MDKMQVIYRQIKQLKPHKNNAKKHTKEQITRIANSIKEFGFLQPVVIDKQNNVLAGHGRILGAKKAGLTEIPTIAADKLTQAQINAYRLADNKLNESAWDSDLLNTELTSLLDDKFDMSLFGFYGVEEQKEHETEVTFKVKEKHQVIVECDSMQETLKLETILNNKGYNCKVKNT